MARSYSYTYGELNISIWPGVDGSGGGGVGGVVNIQTKCSGQ